MLITCHLYLSCLICNSSVVTTLKNSIILIIISFKCYNIPFTVLFLAMFYVIQSTKCLHTCSDRFLVLILVLVLVMVDSDDFFSFSYSFSYCNVKHFGFSFSFKNVILLVKVM